MKLNFKPVYERLSKDRLVRLLKHIMSVQGTELKRLNYPKAAEALGVDRPQIARDVRALEKVGLVIIKNGELCLAPDIVKSDEDK